MMWRISLKMLRSKVTALTLVYKSAIFVSEHGYSIYSVCVSANVLPFAHTHYFARWHRGFALQCLSFYSALVLFSNCSIQLFSYCSIQRLYYSAHACLSLYQLLFTSWFFTILLSYTCTVHYVMNNAHFITG